MLPCLTLSIIKDESRVKWSNPGKGVVPSPTTWCSSYQKGAFRSPSTTVTNFTHLLTLGLKIQNLQSMHTYFTQKCKELVVKKKKKNLTLKETKLEKKKKKKKKKKHIPVDISL